MRCSSAAIALFGIYDDFWDSTDMTVVFRPASPYIGERVSGLGLRPLA